MRRETDWLLVTVILVWLTVVVAGSAVYIPIWWRGQISDMGKACVKHIENLGASADANLLDIYSSELGNTQKEAQNYLWQATAQCMIRYPLYSSTNSDHHDQYNLTTN